MQYFCYRKMLKIIYLLHCIAIITCLRIKLIICLLCSSTALLLSVMRCEIEEHLHRNREMMKRQEEFKGGRREEDNFSIFQDSDEESFRIKDPC